MRDFAPRLHKAMCGEHNLHEHFTGVELVERDQILMDVGAGRLKLLRGFNVWILLEDEGYDHPLVFADLTDHFRYCPGSESSMLTKPCEPTAESVYNVRENGGTRTLKANTYSRTAYRAQHRTRPGDAYIFETWGPRAAWHAGCSRHRCSTTGRRRSVEVRTVIVSN